MRIAYAIPVRYVERLSDGTLVASGIESGALQVPQMPFPGLMRLVVGIAGSHLEAQDDDSHALSCWVEGPELQEAAPRLAVGFKMATRPSSPEGWEVRVTLPAIVRFEVTMPGMYSIELSVDGSTSTSVPIVVTGPPIS